jgi:hypothetical protein
MQCPFCKSAVFEPSRDGHRLKAKMRVLVIRKSAVGDEVDIETNCLSCRQPIVLPLVLAEGPLVIRKADAPRLILRRA